MKDSANKRRLENDASSGEKSEWQSAHTLGAATWMGLKSLKAIQGGHQENHINVHVRTSRYV